MTFTTNNKKNSTFFLIVTFFAEILRILINIKIKEETYFKTNYLNNQAQS